MFKLKKRRGMTSLVEALTCLTLFGVAITMLLSLMSYSNRWTAETMGTMTRKLDTDFLVDMLQMDVKSGDAVEVVGDTLQIVKYNMDADAAVNSGVVTYTFDKQERAVYRNGEEVITGVRSGIVGSPPFQMGADGESVFVRLATADEDVIEITVHR